MDANLPAPAGGKGALALIIGAAAALAVQLLVPQFEGKKNTPYIDVANVPTVCFGDTEHVVMGQRQSDAQCLARLERQLIAHAGPVLACTPGLRGRDGPTVAAVSLAYNIGTGAYCRSTVARRFNAGDWRGGCDAMLAWNRAGGRVVRGLVRRREAERAICLGGI